MEHFINMTTATDVQHDEVNEKVLRNAVREANLVSYGLLVIRNGVIFWGNVSPLTRLHATAFTRR